MQTCLRKTDLSRLSIGYTSSDGSRIVRQFQNDDAGNLVEQQPPVEQLREQIRSRLSPLLDEFPVVNILEVLGSLIYSESATSLYPGEWSEFGSEILDLAWKHAHQSPDLKRGVR